MLPRAAHPHREAIDTLQLWLFYARGLHQEDGLRIVAERIVQKVERVTPLAFDEPACTGFA